MPLTSRSHHELTPPITYGYVPSVQSRIRGRVPARTSPRRGGAGWRSSCATAIAVALVDAQRDRRLRPVTADDGHRRATDQRLGLRARQCPQAGLEEAHGPLDLPADLEQRLTDG